MFTLRKSSKLPLQKLTEIVLLVLLAWPAPLAIGHRHDELSVQVSDQEMMQHLQEHHGGFCNADHWPDDWHWHCFYPGCSCLGVGGEDLTAPAEEMLTGPRFELPAVELWCQFDSSILSRAKLRPKIPEHRRYSFQYVALVHSRQSLPELLGIIRC